MLTTAKRVGGLHRVGAYICPPESMYEVFENVRRVLTTAKHVGGLLYFGECV